MSGSENGAGEVKKAPSPGRVLGGRSASPAKRSADDMNGTAQRDGVGEGMRDVTPGGQETQETAEDTQTQTQQTGGVDSMDTSAPESVGAETEATSFGSEEDKPPPYQSTEPSPLKIKDYADYTTEDIDKQEASVRQMCQKELEEGQKGIVVSWKWLARVMSRSSDGLKSNQFPKEAREGPIGQVDNSDIVPEAGFDEPILNDIEGQPFIPLKPGLQLGEDIEILTNEAWGVVVAAYGVAPGQKQIGRYVRNTASEESTGTNFQYELWPPIFTIRKVPQPKQDDEEEEAPPLSAPTKSSHELMLRVKQRTRGQMSPDDAVKLVSSRQEKFQKFLARSKEAAGIPKGSKVRIFKALDPATVTMDVQPEGASAAPTSENTDPTSTDKLVVTTEDFNKMEIGKELEHVDVKDQTDDPNYNGSSNMELYVLTQSGTLILEEQIGGPGGGEFKSDKKSGARIKLNLAGLRKNGDSKPGSTTNSRGTSPAPGAGIMTRGRTRRDGRTKGTVGLGNLGNTCYMNSALQCIRSVEELAVYFLSNAYKKDINASNPLGHGGTMAKVYANLLGQMYGDNTSGSVAPKAFKGALGNVAPMFSGYGQQDSQEFLSFLVDALHEDLNRVLKKPYNENPDSTDETVKDPQKIIELGETYRSNHHARNDSVAMDLFSGFYKNTMECPKCDKISITFDPFSLLTVQLPNEGSFQHPVTFIPLRDRAINHAIDCDKGWTVKMLKENIASKHSGVDVDRLWMVEVYNNKVYKVFENSTTLAEAGIQTNDHLFVYELEAAPTNGPSPPSKSALYSTSIYSSKNDEKVPDMDDPKGERFAVPVLSRQKKGTGWDVVLHPLYITVTREEAQNYDVIMRKVLVALSRVTSRPVLSEDAKFGGGLGGAADAEMRDAAPTQHNGTTTIINGENGQVTDTSGSEDDYVKVSVEPTENTQANEAPETDGAEKEDRPIPERFMDPQYHISAGLRKHLFELKYGASNDANLHCTGISSFKDGAVRPMEVRVKKNLRRGSTQSTSSSEESTTSNGTGTNGDDVGSDPDDFGDKPDIMLGGDGSDDETLPGNPLDSAPAMSRKDLRKNGRSGKGKKKGRRGGTITYSKKDRRNFNKGQGNGGSALFGAGKLNNPQQDDEDNPYYIKLGECIILDWHEHGADALFGNTTRDPKDPRGYFVSHSEGKNLPFISDPEVEAKRARRETRRKHGITLDECFQETGKREVLSEDNAWYCNRCKELRRATKTLEIWTMPDILVVHLKRFGGNRSFRDKIDTLVDYPLEGLDMTQRVGLKEEGKEYVYDLFAVDNHFGGLGGGHYTAYARNFFDEVWYDYNDSSCSRMNEDRAQSSAAAYLLFYRRRSDKPLGPPALQELVHDFRNPPTNGEPPADDAEESDAGEGRLGGPNGFSRGPSSAGTGAGAGSLRSGGASGGAGARAGGRALMKKDSESSGATGMGTINGQQLYGPERPPVGADWTFNNLDRSGGGEEGASMSLMQSVEGPDLTPEDDDDAASTTAQMDEDGGNASPRLWNQDDEFEDASDTPYPGWAPSSATRTTPIDEISPPAYSSPPYELDDHNLYTSGRGNLDSLHLNDTGMTGTYEDDDDDAPPPLVLNSDPPTPASGDVQQEHDKLD
ncbi:uncharacterized protein LTR77_001776 [Saxophila tyrrhenica]|uniref:ubiquitinyl hydrolase 1 n=1 Tax=Saxophila tyrrhenica TaxID=1690608 RepID=A0AAV9PQX8_9PEZI|nr:hypothetical protein LTR77_001776 [Saxophila tyrrhenica]